MRKHCKVINGLENNETHMELQRLYHTYRSIRPNSKLDENELKICDLRFRVLVDKNVNEFVKHIKRGDQIIINAFTKIDKLNSSELQKLKREYPDGIFVSNLKKQDIIDLQNKITEHLFGN